MNSINKNQPEDNLKNLSGEQARKKIKELAEKASSCFFCTDIKTGSPVSVRPMAPEKIDEEGNFWFLSADDSHKNIDVQKDPYVQLLFQGSSHSDFLSLYGKVDVSRNQEKIDELWDPMMKTWFTEGKEDPRITVLKFSPVEGYYWDTKHGMAVALLKRVYGAIKGETFDDSVEGEVKP
ncbi:pyridoxamine 5'-phosphate oxidase family protein [Flavobacterium sp. NST-5]|uniref:Pyridoxamine 5'-phosphate oxidase family protein n=1 Tax=Flavobacterium ichthyis TaxID=2698827 RepID=A0ABW9Z780_9FLAO|nr:pyridoxamine 5'-phosphate oxidase family protein [Flavobacterium ichthyis]NBL63694.1 pyridoxamine 5'-phosphate oxidase family protein [Flavobacterium ichthyis]